MKFNWQLQGPCSRNVCHWVVWLPCCRLSRAVVRSRWRSLSWMLINAQSLDNWGRTFWLARSKAFPGILGTCPLLKDDQIKSHFSAIYSAHGSLQYCLLDTINSWSSGWEFISHVERENGTYRTFRILFFFLLFAKGLTFKVSEQVLLHLTLWKLIYNALMDWLPPPSLFTLCFQCPLPWYWEAVCSLLGVCVQGVGCDKHMVPSEV